jgi:hypothetical protein
MRALLTLAIVPFLFAGCAGTADVAAPLVENEPVQAASPEPVAIHDAVNLVDGEQRTWSFTVEPGATTVEMRFFATGKAVAGAGLPTCLTIETPAGADTAGICQGGGTGNVQVAPYLVVNERVFYEDSGADVPAGDYTFTLDAQPSATDFHAMVTVSYD